MLEVTKIRKELAACLEHLALILNTLDVNSPTDIDIKVIEFLASITEDLGQK
jgi:hypothetical protein